LVFRATEWDALWRMGCNGDKGVHACMHGGERDEWDPVQPLLVVSPLPSIPESQQVAAKGSLRKPSNSTSLNSTTDVI